MATVDIDGNGHTNWNFFGGTRPNGGDGGNGGKGGDCDTVIKAKTIEGFVFESQESVGKGGNAGIGRTGGN